LDLVDPVLSIQIDEELMVQRVITIALSCLQASPGRRPTMGQVVGMLQGDIGISESVRGRGDEEINQIYHSRLHHNNTSAGDDQNPTFMPRDEESEVIYLGKGSSSRNFCPKAIEQFCAIKSR